MGVTPVVRSLETLPRRFKAADPPISARFRLHVGRAVRDVVVDRNGCAVVKPNGVRPDAEITTDADTWFEMDQGRLSGIEAFADRRLFVRGSIEKSVMFEPMFERPSAGAMEYSVRHVGGRGRRISTLIAGREDAPPLVMIHGLGATKSSWLPIVPELSTRYRVIAIDLPGFGSSSKPRGAYNAPWFAGRVFRALDDLGIERASLVGNSMGGRISMEMAMQDPERIQAIACLCPVAAFSRRPWLWLVKLLRPELAFAPSRLPRRAIQDGLRQLFSDPDRVDDSWYEAAVDDFLMTWRSPRARMAFSASARNIYLEEPEGEEGFWARLTHMECPSLYVYGVHDILISAHFGHRVRRCVPSAEVQVWNDCGHVPQIEFPDRTLRTLNRFFGRHAKERKAS